MVEEKNSIQTELMKALVNSESNSYRDTFDLDKTISMVNTTIVDSCVVNDEYGNSLLAIGNQNKVEKFTDYSYDNNTLNWTLWTALYNDSWVFKRAIDKPAQDMVNCGIKLQSQSEVNEKVMKTMKKHRFDFIQLLQWGMLYGGSVLAIMFDNMTDEEYKKPINYKLIKESKVIRMYAVDRWYGVSPSYNNTVTDMKDIDFGKPKFYDITFGDGHSITMHHDYVLRFEGRTAPKLIKNGQLQGWGYAEGAHIINEITRDEKLKSSIQSLVDKSLIEVIKMSGMRGVFMGADKENETQLYKRLEMVNWARNFNSLTLLDKDDEYSQNEFSGLSGLAQLLEQNMWMISSALEMQGVLFGDLKNGFSTDAEALERYDETIRGRCESYLRPVYEKFVSMLYKMYGEDKVIPEFDFESLFADKQDEKKMEALNKFIDTCQKLLNDGVITTTQYAKALEKYYSDGVIDFSIDKDFIEELKTREKEEDEAFDINALIPKQ